MTAPREGHVGTTAPVIWAAMVTFLVVMGIGLVPPALPLFARHYGLSTAEIALMLTAFAFGRMAFSLPGGVIADRFGFKRVAVIGCGVTACGALVAATLPTFWVLIAAQVVQGVGSALYTTAALAAILTSAPDGRAGRVTALYQGVVLIGMSAAPAVGGVSVGLVGLSGPFVVYAAAAVAGLVLSAWKLPSHAGVARVESTRQSDMDHQDTSRPTGLVMALLRHPAVVLALILSFATFWVVAGVRNTLIPVFAESALDFGPVASGWLLTGAALANAVVLRHAGRKIDRARRPVVIWGTLGMGAAVASLALATSPWLLITATVFLGVTKGYAGVVPITVIVDVADPRIRGTAIGFQRMATGLGLTVGPYTAGLLADRFGYPATFAATGLVITLVAILMVRIPETGVASRETAR